jgi:hypothetical protein
MVCVTPLPPSGDEGGGSIHASDPEWAWFALQAGGKRVTVQQGMHVDPGAAVVKLWPEHWRPSPEPTDTMIVRLVTVESRGAQALRAASVTPIPATYQAPACARCGWVAPEGTGVVVPFPVPALRHQAAKLNPYATEHEPADLAESAYVKAWADATVAARRALKELERATRDLHPVCPADTAPLDLGNVVREEGVTVQRGGFERRIGA